MFHVSTTGPVTTPSYPESLYLVQFSREDNRGGAPAFLEVGQWTFPLLRGRSPVLRSALHSYLSYIPSYCYTS